MTPLALRNLRLDMGLTQTQASRYVWVTLRTWQRWESGETPVPAPMVELIKLKFGNPRTI